MAPAYNPKKRHKTSKTGVFYRYSTTNGKKDKTFYIVYKDENKDTVESKVGKESEGVGVNYAYQKYTETLQKIKHGEVVPIKRKRKKVFTFDDAFTEYIEYAKSEKGTWKKDMQLYNKHLVDFHQRELISLSIKDFNTLKLEKMKIYATSTVKYILAVARQIINFAIKNELVKGYVNPISGGKVKVKKFDNKNVGFFTQEQAELLLKTLEKEKGSPSHIYELTVLLLHTGARFSEVASLTWNDINFNENTIYFKPTKDGNKRHIAMSHLVQEVLKSLPRDNELILSTYKGTQIKQMPKRWQKIVDKLFPENKTTIKRVNGEQELIELSDEEQKILQKQKKKRLTPHSLRHTHASWMAMSGKFNLMEIRDELGHKSITMTERYSHLLPEDRHKKVSELFN